MREQIGVFRASPCPGHGISSHLLSLPAHSASQPPFWEGSSCRARGTVAWLEAGDLPPDWDTPFQLPGLARNGFILCKDLSHENKITELLLGLVLHLPSGKMCVMAIPRLAKGPPAQPHVADPPPPSPNLPAGALSAALCIQNDMSVVSKKSSAWWSLGP